LAPEAFRSYTDRAMKVVYDYGMLPGGRHRYPAGIAASRRTDGGSGTQDGQPGAPAGRRRTEPVIIIHRGPEAGAAGAAGAAGRDGVQANGRDNLHPAELTPEARARDREVRGHERAHLLSLGAYAASGIQLTETTGPGGQAVAVAGRVKADLTEVSGNPQATLRKAHAVQRAALAPGEPSAADMRVAAEAYRLAQTAREKMRSHLFDENA